MNTCAGIDAHGWVMAWEHLLVWGVITVRSCWFIRKRVVRGIWREAANHQRLLYWWMGSMQTTSLTYCGPSTSVVNHNCFFDVMLLMNVFGFKCWSMHAPKQSLLYVDPHGTGAQPWCVLCTVFIECHLHHWLDVTAEIQFFLKCAKSFAVAPVEESAGGGSRHGMPVLASYQNGEVNEHFLRCKTSIMNIWSQKLRVDISHQWKGIITRNPKQMMFWWNDRMSSTRNR